MALYGWDSQRKPKVRKDYIKKQYNYAHGKVDSLRENVKDGIIMELARKKESNERGSSKLAWPKRLVFQQKFKSDTCQCEVIRNS